MASLIVHGLGDEVESADMRDVDEDRCDESENRQLGNGGAKR